MDFLNDEYLQNISQPLYEISQQMSAEVVGIIAERIKEIGTLSASDVNRLRNTMRIADFKKIEKELARLTGLGTSEIDRIFDDVAKENDAMAKTLYEYRGIKPIPYSENAILQGIVQSAIKNAKADFLNISATRAFNIGGKPTELSVAYNKVVDKAIFEVSQGTVDYNTAMRKSVLELANSGLQTVDYQSGYSRRLDSSVRMNLLDGARQMSMSMRKQQGKEFGADGVEISVHSLCAPDHQPIQGKQYSTKEFEALQSTLERPIGTNNCKHTTFPIIVGLSEPTYSKKELQSYIDSSNKQVTFTSLSGKEITQSRYECTQYQRQVETRIRQLKDQKNALSKIGDDLQAKRVQTQITVYTREYKRISEEIGISPKLKRLTVVK